jgi:hypothetical protein
MKKKNRLLRLSLIVAILAFLSTGLLPAATITFVGGTNDWNTASNWSPAIVPTSADDAIIPTGFTVTTSSAITARTISIYGNSTLTITQNADIATTSTGGITLNGTSSLIINAAVAVNIGNATYRGDIVQNDNSNITFSTAAATVTLSGTWTVATNATITNTTAPDLSVVGATAVTLPSTLTSLNSLTVNKPGSTCTLSDDLTTTTSLGISAGTLIVGNNDLTVTTTTSIALGATLNAASTATNTRTFSGIITLNGTLISSGGSVTNIFTSALSIPATGVLTINNSTSDFGGTVAGVASGATINAYGATVSFTGAVTFTNLTLNTNSNTNLTFNAAQTAGNQIPALTVHNLTFANDAALAGNVTVYGNFTNTATYTTDVNAFTFTVYGTFNNPTGAFFDAVGSTVKLYGPVTSWGTDETEFITNNTTTLEILGSGSLPANFTIAANNNFGNFTLNRPGATFTVSGNYVVGFNTLTITSGTVVLPDEAHSVTTTTTIGANGVLDLSAVTTANNGITFTTGLAGSGQIIANGGNGAGEPVITIAAGCNYTFTGDILTNQYTILRISSTQTSDIELPSSITQLSSLMINRGNVARKVILNSNLTITDNISALVFASGRFELNGKTITFSGTYVPNTSANFIMDATEGSTVVFNGAPTFAANGLITDETTNFQMGAAATIHSTITTLNNLTITTGTTALGGDLTLYGNLSVASGATLNKATFNLTVYGDVSNLGTLTLSGASGTITLYGQMIGSGTYTTGTSTVLSIQGTSSQFILPAGITTLGRLTLNRPAGMKIMAGLTVGDGAGGNNDITITLGDLDLNGFNVTLANANAQISETAGNTFINTGLSTSGTGYVTTASSTAAEIASSGIGVTSISGPTGITVRRYPRTVPIAGVGLATHRIYYITGTGSVTAVTLAFDNTELYSNAADLKLYHTTDYTFVTSPTEVSGTVTENTPVTGKGELAVSGVNIATGNYYALAAAPGDGGVLRTFVGTSGNWGNPNSWSPTGIPTKVDQVVIGPATVTVNGNGAIYECKTLLLNHPAATIQPADNTINGDVVSLRVMGNITMNGAPGAEILGVNGKGRLNLIIGDGVTAGVSSTISVNNSYTTGSGIWVHNFSVNAADVTGSANRIRISGDVALLANSAVQGMNVEFWGGYDPLQTISVPQSAYLSFNTIRADNDASVSTQSDITVTDKFEILSGSTFNATGGTTYFTTAVANDGDPWTVQSGGTLKLFNVELNSSGGQTFVPLGTAYIQGNLYQYGTDAFTPNSGKVIFSNLGQREIINTQTASELEFYELEVSESSKVITSNDFNIKNEINVKANGSFIANNGTITFTGNGNIYNASNQTLIFNDLTIIGIVNTSDSWEIHGNLVVTGSLLADGGTITFKNIQEKYINNNGTLRFFKLKVADGSKLTTNTNHDFTIRNNATNPLGAGIEVEGTGEFYVGAASSNITFDVGVGVSAGNPKTIVKSDAGRLEFGVITIAANPNNEVATSSDFTITGTGANTFLNSGAGGKFTATGGTITFTGAAPEISSISPASTQFYSIRTEGPTALAVPNQAQELFVAGDFTIDGLSSMDFTANDASRVVFNGSSLQKITGNTNAVTPIQFADVTLNKTGNSELLLELNVTIASNANHELVLTNGILNLGSSTFTVGAGAMSRLNGVINGGTGTYIVAANHVTPLLEDAYFTVSGVPTLYNLTINNAHTTANDLTVNGTLDLATANLTIGSGASAVNPMKLILNGNLTRTTGLLNGSATLSRLVLQGTGTVTNGISNSYFVGTAATTVQLEVARKETLGGNLNIANGSYLRINTGINDFDLGTHTLTFNNTFNLVMISGGIKAGTGSSVVLPAAATSLPATMFRNNECYNLTIAAPISLLSDLRINGTLTGAFSITTNDNVLTFGPNATLPAYSSGSYVVGNLRRYVKNTSTKFDVGMGGKYLPVTLQFAKATSEQAIVVRSNYVNPTVGKGGDPTKPLLALWTITPEGGEINDSIKVRFEWSSTIEQIAPSSGTTFPAKWGGNSWVDYRNNIYVGSQVLYTNAYPIKGSSALNGDWAIFVADNSTDTAKDNAIKVNTLKLVITEIEPNPVVLGQAFKVTVQLQNQYGQAVTVNSPLSFNLSLLLGSGTFTSINDVIPIGQSYITLQGLSITTSAGGNHQFKVVPTVPSIDTLGSVSQLFDVLPAAPTSQATALTFTNITPTTATISWTNGNGAARIVLIKPDTLLRLTEYPLNGETYYGNTIVGLGSNLGAATVLYNGTGSSINVVGLAPNTKYYVYVFEYNGTDGNEHYRTIAAAGNPKSFETTGSYDDDVTFGPNNTRALSKAIGTNVPVRGTVKSSTDEDWFNFSVASTTPNVRVKLTNLAGDYTLEFYDTTGRRIRRSTLSGKSSEAAVVNGLPAGTYTVRIFSADGSYWTKTGDEYILQVSTYGSEIYSVTP